MLECDRINDSEEIDINKTNILKEYDIVHYWYYLNQGSQYEPYLCIGCNEKKAIKFNDVAIVSIKGRDCRIHLWYMSKDNAANMMNNSDLNEKSGLLKIFS